MSLAAGRPASGATADKRLDILVLGGTGFVGPNQIEYALSRGHRVTMFNRGQTAAGLYGSRVETLLGNRDARVDQGLKALEGRRRWDVVIDNSGYVPRHVRDSATLLQGRVGRYLFVSSISAYPLESGGSFAENNPLYPAPPAEEENATGENYGPLKAECDRLVRDVFGAAATIVRPTYIVGPGDDTDRFTYWVERISRGGDVLAPPDPGETLQWIDVRDLGAWMITLAENDTAGVFNAASPPTPWSEVLNTLGAASRQSPRLRRVTPQLLERLDIQLPLIVPGMAPWFVETVAAEAAGLKVRPLLETARDTLSWWRTLPQQRRANPQGWLTAEQEKVALDRLRRV